MNDEKIKQQKSNKCRKCSECKDSDHHWIETANGYICKHCEVTKEYDYIECQPERDEDIIKCVSPEDKKLHKALRNALIKPEQKYELQWAIDRIEELKPAELNEADKYDRIKLFLLNKENEIHTRLENAEAEKEAARDLWINAQKACKKHALRADKAEAEIERLRRKARDLIKNIRKFHNSGSSQWDSFWDMIKDYEQALKG